MKDNWGKIPEVQSINKAVSTTTMYRKIHSILNQHEPDYEYLLNRLMEEMADAYRKDAGVAIGYDLAMEEVAQEGEDS